MRQIIQAPDGFRLSLTRKVGDKLTVRIGKEEIIEIMVTRLKGSFITLAFKAPDNVEVKRGELSWAEFDDMMNKKGRIEKVKN